jgi:hypothetical protein
MSYLLRYAKPLPAWLPANHDIVFAGVVMDQAGLVGLMRRLHGLGVVLLSVKISQQVVQCG